MEWSACRSSNFNFTTTCNARRFDRAAGMFKRYLLQIFKQLSNPLDSWKTKLLITLVSWIKDHVRFIQDFWYFKREKAKLSFSFCPSQLDVFEKGHCQYFLLISTWYNSLFATFYSLYKVLYMSFDKFLLSVESRDPSQADLSIIWFPKNKWSVNNWRLNFLQNECSQFSQI